MYPPLFSVQVAHISSYFLKFLSYKSLLGLKSSIFKAPFQPSLELLSNAEGKSFFSFRFLKVKDSMKISLHAIFQFDMSQLNLNNFQTDRATWLCLDSKDAPFQAVSEFDFIGFRFYKCMLVFTGET